MIDSLLVFRPERRPSCAEALAHPFFRPLHDPEDEPEAPAPCVVAGEGEVWSEAQIKGAKQQGRLSPPPSPKNLTRVALGHFDAAQLKSTKRFGACTPTCPPSPRGQTKTDTVLTPATRGGHQHVRVHSHLPLSPSVALCPPLPLLWTPEYSGQEAARLPIALRLLPSPPMRLRPTPECLLRPEHVVVATRAD